MLNMYYDCIKDKEYSNATLITLSNKSACDIAQSIRPRLGFRGKTIDVDDLLLVTQNNLISGLMNGDLIKIKQLQNRRKRAGLTFIEVEVESFTSNTIYSQLLIEDTIYSGETNLSQVQQTNLLIDFHERMKDKGIKQRTERYNAEMQIDPYLNALRCTFGYAITCHKSQGGEWDKVFLNIPRGLAYHNPAEYTYRWVYTAMTRAKQELYVMDDFYITNANERKTFLQDVDLPF